MTSWRRSAKVEHLGAALGFHCRNIGYLRAQKLGARRIDLDGNEVGEVDEQQAANAEKAIAGLREAAWKRKREAHPRPETEAPAAAVAPRPCRQSLPAARRAMAWPRCGKPPSDARRRPEVLVPRSFPSSHPWEQPSPLIDQPFRQQSRHQSSGPAG